MTSTSVVDCVVTLRKLGHVLLHLGNTWTYLPDFFTAWASTPPFDLPVWGVGNSDPDFFVDLLVSVDLLDRRRDQQERLEIRPGTVLLGMQRNGFLEQSSMIDWVL